MALSDLTFKLYTDSGLTAPFSSLYQLTHSTDLSDNPQDFKLYFGSATANRKLEAVSNPGVDSVTLTPTDSLADWKASTAYSLGALVEPTTPNTYKYVCTTAGTSDSSEPTWPTTPLGSTVTDGTAVWTLVGKRHETTEITLATSSGDLATNTPGAALAIGTTIQSGTGNAVELHIRVVNAVTTVSSNTSQPELTVNINSVIEQED